MSDINISDYTENLLNTNSEDFSLSLIKLACEEGKVEKLRLLNNYSELQTAKVLKAALKKVVKSFEKLAKDSCKQYISDMAQGINKCDSIVNVKTYNICANFYKKQYDEVADIIKEYYCYMFRGNLFLALFAERPYSEYYDYRKEKPEVHE